MGELLSQPVVLPVSEPEPLTTAPVRATFDAELEQAAAAEPSERRAIAERLNAQLAALPRDGGRPVADLLIGLLEGGRLGDLVDWEGRTCRAAAAEALIALGYPYALELSPEDLDHVRQGGGFRTPAPHLVSGLGIVAATSGLEAVAHAAAGNPLVLAHAALTLGSAGAVALTRPLSRARRWAQVALVIAGAEGIALSVFDAPAALLSGLAAIVAAALMAKTR